MTICEMANAYVSLGWQGFPVTSIKASGNGTLENITLGMSFIGYMLL